MFTLTIILLTQVFRYEALVMPTKQHYIPNFMQESTRFQSLNCKVMGPSEMNQQPLRRVEG